MLAKVQSAAVIGIDSYPIEIEVNASWGQPAVIIVGLPDAAVKESRDRVKTAIENSGFKHAMGRTTINLAPADIKKEGWVQDLGGLADCGCGRSADAAGGVGEGGACVGRHGVRAPCRGPGDRAR